MTRKSDWSLFKKCFFSGSPSPIRSDIPYQDYMFGFFIITVSDAERKGAAFILQPAVSATDAADDQGQNQDNPVGTGDKGSNIFQSFRHFHPLPGLLGGSACFLLV